MKKEGKGDESKNNVKIKLSARMLFRSMNCACAVKINTNVLKILQKSSFKNYKLSA
jgi:hypothetical protein